MNSNIFKCEYCKSTFANKSNLSYHKKNAKFCLIKRGEEKSRVILVDNICEYCDKKFSSKQRLLTHKEICYKKDKILKKDFLLKEMQEKDTVIYTLKTENKNLREQIESLQQKLASIAIEGVRNKHKDLYEDEEHKIEEKRETEDFYKPLDSSLVLKDSYQLVYRPEDGYIDVTNLCKAGSKQYYHWKELKRTKAFLQVLSSSLAITIDVLLKYQTGSNSERKTWVHPQVAINIAQWISPEFDVQVSR